MEHHFEPKMLTNLLFEEGGQSNDKVALINVLDTDGFDVRVHL